jgi:AraC-like DNA-binding protein
MNGNHIVGVNAGVGGIGRRVSIGAERVVADFSQMDGGVPVLLGRVNYSRAHTPLLEHVHEGRMEFVYVVKGRQSYAVGGVEHVVGSGEIFHTRAGELHSSSASPEDKSLFYYLIADVENLACGFIGHGGEGRRIADALKALPARVFKAGPDARRLLDGILACAEGAMPYRETALRNQLSTFLLGVIEWAGRRAIREPAAMQTVLDYIEDNIHEEIGMNALAGIAGLSLPRFKASFRKRVGIPPREYVLRKKVEKAKELLANPSRSVTEVAYNLQFSSSQYFATVFKRYTSVTPGQYRSGTARRRG